jgi:hypothetical protein
MYNKYSRLTEIHRQHTTRGRRGSESPACALVQRCDDTSILFRDTDFEITELQKVLTHLKISKNKSCRGTIDLQLLQREAYVLINGFAAKTR